MEILDNRRVAPYFPPAYYAHMKRKSFGDRALERLNDLGMSKAELSRASGVPYHAIDKFMKRDGATTSAENALAIARVLGINVDDRAEVEEVERLFQQLSAEQKQFVLASLRGLLKK